MHGIRFQKMTNHHSLGEQDFKAAKTIFLQVFQRADLSDFIFSWKNRDTKDSLGVYSTPVKKLIGFALVDNQRTLHFIGIAPAHQKYKLGTQLLHTLLKNCMKTHQSLFLVPTMSDPIVAWYKKNGFYETSTFKTRVGTRWIKLAFHTYHTRRQTLFLKF